MPDQKQPPLTRKELLAIIEQAAREKDEATRSAPSAITPSAFDYHPSLSYTPC